jgi:hypothetical protein
LLAIAVDSSPVVAVSMEPREYRDLPLRDARDLC